MLNYGVAELRILKKPDDTIYYCEDNANENKAAKTIEYRSEHSLSLSTSI